MSRTCWTCGRRFHSAWGLDLHRRLAHITPPRRSGKAS